ncbi:hypothetical protein [Stappia indica]|uniref:hypothetical protein n=1 Tax=Stappia indica TaxID=538381 RepID=UPI001CD347A1|nr:hypothetical protein [Stappia indica]MCA1300819.1 hypothetical protein [Stappia indica]
MSQQISCHSRSNGAAPSVRSSARPDPLQAARPFSWWRQDAELGASAIDLIAACLDAARATVATIISDTDDLPGCYQALEDHIRSGGIAHGEDGTLDLLASALLVAIDGARGRLAECEPITLMDLCAPVAGDGLGPLPDPSMVTQAYSLLQDARWLAAFNRGDAVCREVRQ